MIDGSHGRLHFNLLLFLSWTIHFRQTGEQKSKQKKSTAIKGENATRQHMTASFICQDRSITKVLEYYKRKQALISCVSALTLTVFVNFVIFLLSARSTTPAQIGASDRSPERLFVPPPLCLCCKECPLTAAV